MNATTASFLGLRRRQRAQDLLREAPRKALRRAPASQCARANQSAIRIAAIAFVHVNCTAQSRVTLIHCITHQLLVNLVAGAVLVMFAPPGQGGVGPSVRMGRRSPRNKQEQPTLFAGTPPSFVTVSRTPSAAGGADAEEVAATLSSTRSSEPLPDRKSSPFEIAGLGPLGFGI